MKVSYAFLLSFFSYIGILTAGDFELKISPTELGYTDSAYIVYFEQIDQEYLGLIVESFQNGHNIREAWVYHLKTKDATNITYTNNQGIVHRIEENDFYSAFSSYGIRHFLKDGDWVYSVVSCYGCDTLVERSSYLLGHHLVTNQQKLQFLRGDCLGFTGFIQYAADKFIIETQSCDVPFRLLAFNDSSWAEVWSIQDFGWRTMINYETQMPFHHKGKIYLSAQDELYVFNTADYRVDTIINDTRDTDGLIEGCTSLVTQYFVHDDDVYIVYRDIATFYYYVVTIAMNAEGYTRIWKTDGTQKGTELVNRLPKTEELAGSLLSSKIFELDNRLLWLGDVDTTNQSRIYEIKGSTFDLLGEISYIDGPIAHVLYNTPYWYKIPLYNLITPVSFADQDIWAYIQRISPETGEDSYYLSLIGLEGNEIKKYLENYSVLPEETESYWKPYDIRVWNINESMVITRFGEKQKDSISLPYMDLLVNEGYKTINFDTISPGEISPGSLLYSIKLEEQLLFNYGENENLSIWSYGKKAATGLKKHLSENKLELTVYPNPVSQSFKVLSSENLSGRMMIVGVDGRVHQTAGAFGLQHQVDISNLQNGMYSLVYFDDWSHSSVSFIVQR